MNLLCANKKPRGPAAAAPLKTKKVFTAYTHAGIAIFITLWYN